jgi:UDP-N-acetylglucosamine--N-acetylmuramyl-(pentapeptide) pyrophosphoryl-undecaprenol N-acetylglucosamine transferase
VHSDAALMVTDADARATLVSTTLNLLKDDSRMKLLSHNIQGLGRPDATEKITDELVKLIA